MILGVTVSLPLGVNEDPQPAVAQKKPRASARRATLGSYPHLNLESPLSQFRRLAGAR